MNNTSKEIIEKLNEEEMLLEMATIGRYGKYTYRIYGNEGNIPHFHVLKDNNTIQCIRLDKAEYFTHNGKYTNRLNSGERKDLIEFLKLKHFDKYDITNWEYVVSQWNLENTKFIIAEDLTMPDYSKIKFAK